MTLDSSKIIDYQTLTAVQHGRDAVFSELRFADYGEQDAAVNAVVAETQALPVGKASHPSMARMAARVERSAAKRMLDIFGALSGLVLLAPLFLIVAIAIRLDSRGPIFFRQWRYGANKVPFQIIKFRSMTVLEASGPFVQARRNDARITRVGAFLRKTSIDELPQLLNVLRGQMSLVGPRPHAIAMDEAYGLQIPNYRDRHLVKPGLSGLAQIEGYRGPTDSDDAIKARVTCDRLYIRSWSIGRDLRILILTPLRLFSGGAF